MTPGSRLSLRSAGTQREKREAHYRLSMNRQFTARWLWALRLGHCSEAQDETRGGDAAQRGERRAVAGMDHDEARERRGQRRTYPVCGDDRTLRDIESAGAAHEIGHGHREQRAVDAGADTVEELHAHQPERIVRQRIE